MSVTMTNRIARKQVTDLARRLGFTVSTSAPGDGVRRFEFCKQVPNGGVDRMCYGAREAWVFLVGYEAGVNSGEVRS